MNETFPCLFYIAVGDAYGAGFEFADRKFIRKNNDLTYHSHPNSMNPYPGRYTDDTQMSIAIAKHIRDKAPVNQYHIADYFLKEFRDYPIRGYARRFQNLLETCVLDYPDGFSTQMALDRFMSIIKPDSARNGSVMRSVPVGMLESIDEVINYSCVQSSITHASLDTIKSATAVAMAAHHFRRRGGKKKGLVPFLKRHGLDLGFDFKYKRVPCDALITTKTAIKLVLDYDNLSDILKRAINIGGDTDSVASVAAGLGSVCGEIDNHLPESLWFNLKIDSKDAKIIGHMANVPDSVSDCYKNTL